MILMMITSSLNILFCFLSRLSLGRNSCRWLRRSWNRLRRRLRRKAAQTPNCRRMCLNNDASEQWNSNWLQNKCPALSSVQTKSQCAAKMPSGRSVADLTRSLNTWLKRFVDWILVVLSSLPPAPQFNCKNSVLLLFVIYRDTVILDMNALTNLAQKV